MLKRNQTGQVRRREDQRYIISSFLAKYQLIFFSVTNVGNISPRVGPLLGTRKCGTGIFSLAVTKAANM